VRLTLDAKGEKRYSVRLTRLYSVLTRLPAAHAKPLPGPLSPAFPLNQVCTRIRMRKTTYETCFESKRDLV